jgi:catechol 2,3-dioxygenase-like lactoylglutathione lyase family enzyme
MTLNHTIVPAHDKEQAARFLAGLLDLTVEHPPGPFAAVRVNDTLTLDFADRATFESHHYAFQVSDDEFDQIFDRVRRAGVSYSADPHHREIGEINHRKGGRGFYFFDPNGHNFELLTRS